MDTNRTAKLRFVQVLTLSRAVLVFVFLAINITAAKPIATNWFVAAFALMIISAVTDMLDGHFARKLKVQSSFGAYVDPLMDKVFYLVALPTLVYLAALDGQLFHAGLLLVLTVCFLLRDQWVSFLRSIGAIQGVDAKANWSGKLRTAISFPAVCVIYYYLAAPRGWLNLPAAIIYTLEAACLAINIISMVTYTIYYAPSLKREMNRCDDAP